MHSVLLFGWAQTSCWCLHKASVIAAHGLMRYERQPGGTAYVIATASGATRKGNAHWMAGLVQRLKTTTHPLAAAAAPQQELQAEGGGAEGALLLEHLCLQQYRVEAGVRSAPATPSHPCAHLA